MGEDHAAGRRGYELHTSEEVVAPGLTARGARDRDTRLRPALRLDSGPAERRRSGGTGGGPGTAELQATRSDGLGGGPGTTRRRCHRWRTGTPHVGAGRGPGTTQDTAAPVEDRDAARRRRWRTGAGRGAGGGPEPADIKGARGRSHGPVAERTELGLGEPESTGRRPRCAVAGCFI